MQDFLARLGVQDRVVLIGDIRQHQGVEAGRPFEQLQEAGMKTAKLDEIIRQKEPQLKLVVEHLARGETAAGLGVLKAEGRITQIADRQDRIQAIAQNYASNPERTLIVSPDNKSRRDLNQAVRSELQARGGVGREGHSLRVLVPRQDITGAERAWAACYQVNDVVRYTRGSARLGLERDSYARVVATNLQENTVTVEKASGEAATYNPNRLAGVAVFRPLELEFSAGDRVQFTSPNRELGVPNRQLGTLQAVSSDGDLSVKLDDRERIVNFNIRENPHLDHGYAVTSHSSQGSTTDRVLINIDTDTHPDLINSRLGYVSVSRARLDAQIFTNDAAALEKGLSHDDGKTSAVDFKQDWFTQEIPQDSSPEHRLSIDE
jgi:ATP-dependent exoDNAse (exonuclease V) alpha subunit